MAVVREGSSLGPCNVLGPLVRETKTRFVYCPHRGQIAFAQRSPRIHLEPCKCCPDHPASATPICTEPPYDRRLANVQRTNVWPRQTKARR